MSPLGPLRSLGSMKLLGLICAMGLSVIGSNGVFEIFLLPGKSDHILNFGWNDLKNSITNERFVKKLNIYFQRISCSKLCINIFPNSASFILLSIYSMIRLDSASWNNGNMGPNPY